MGSDDRRWLLEVAFDAQVHTFALEPGRSYTIGRDPSADVRLSDRRISRRHCMLVSHEHHWRIVDLGSRRGIRVNGVACGDHVLQDGDEVALSDRVTLRAVLAAPDIEVIVPGRPGERRRHRRIALLLGLLLVAAGATAWLHHAGLLRSAPAPRSRFDGREAAFVLAELARLAARPEEGALQDLLALDAQSDWPDASDPVLQMEVSLALLDALTAAARRGDGRAVDALAVRLDRPGALPALLDCGAAGLEVVLDRVNANKLAPEEVVDHLARVSAPAARELLSRVVGDDAQDALLRAEAISVLEDDVGLVPDEELLRMVEAARVDPLDRDAGMLALRAASVLAARDPQRHGPLAAELVARLERRSRRRGP